MRELCAQFPGEYWRELEPDRYPERVRRRADRARLARGADPRGVRRRRARRSTAASVILEEINASGGNAGACHAQMYTMGTMLRHGSDEQKQRYLPKIAAGELRLQAFGVTEPTAGSDTTQHPDARRARRRRLRRQRPEDLDLARRALRPDAAARAHDAARAGREAHRRASRSSSSTCASAGGRDDDDPPDQTMMNHATTEIFFDGVELPADALIGEEGKGFRYILDGMNAERILIAAECIGDGALLRREARALRARARRLRPADRREPGRPVPDRAAPTRRSRRPT